jgi:hypothetical protein
MQRTEKGKQSKKRRGKRYLLEDKCRTKIEDSETNMEQTIKENRRYSMFGYRYNQLPRLIG